MAAGFRRWATYRQATVASAFTNSVFGFLRVYVLRAVAAGAGGTVAGYDPAILASYVWFGQGLIGVVMLFTWTDLADRVRTGEVTADLLRPVDPVWSYLAADLGRAGHAALFRLMVPVAVGAACFDLSTPDRWLSYPLFALSLLLAVLVSFGIRYLVNLTAFWLLDVRGAMTLWLFGSTLLSGLVVPIRFLPDWAQWLLWLGTPFPAIVQAPLDVYVEYADLTGQLLTLADQALWVALGLLLCRWVQHRALRKLVIQGG
jgi:ABC-2 type transport system permease protein